MAFDAKTVTTNDWGVMGAAAGVFLFSLIGSFITYSVEVSEELEGLGGIDDSGGVTNAWTGYAVLGLLLLLAVGALAAARVFADVQLPQTGVGWNLIAAAAAGLGALLVILRAFTAGEDVGGFGLEASSGPGWSGYVVMILAVVETAFAVLAFRTSGEQVPWQQGGGGASPSSAGAPPPAAAPPAAPPPSAGPPSTPPPAPPPTTGSSSAPPPAPPPTTGPPSAPPPG
jgi:hypothetical protein